MREAARLDLEAVQELKEIMEDEFGALIETYLEDALLKIDMLNNCVEAKDGSMLREAAHSFKGASCNIGALALADLCESAEQFSREGDVEQAAAMVPNIVVEFEQVRTLLQAEITS